MKVNYVVCDWCASPESEHWHEFNGQDLCRECDQARKQAIEAAIERVFYARRALRQQVAVSA